MRGKRQKGEAAKYNDSDCGPAEAVALGRADTLNVVVDDGSIPPTQDSINSYNVVVIV